MLWTLPASPAAGLAQKSAAGALSLSCFSAPSMAQGQQKQHFPPATSFWTLRREGNKY